MSKFLCMKDLEPAQSLVAAVCDRSQLLGFPDYRDWNFDYQSELKPKGIKVIYRTKELEERQARSRIWNETWLADFFYKPCNYELFVKQSLNMEMAIVMARDTGMDWIIHLDTNELIHPAGAREYSLRQLLADVPGNVDTVIFPNDDSIVERDITEPYTEVSLFKKNYDHLPKETFFGYYKDATRGNPNYFLIYGNGKFAAQVQGHHGKFAAQVQGFIIASTATDKEMHRWFREHIVWSDKELALKLPQRGILTRIYAPMVIAQGLGEIWHFFFCNQNGSV